MVVIRVLGRFEVWAGGELVPASAWQSRKARDVLRFLIARRGRPVPREELTNLLWPGKRPARTGHRLSNQLSVVRAALGTAPARTVGDVLVVDRTTVGLDLTRVRVDVEDFLAAVAAGRRPADSGATTRITDSLAAAERSYHGDPFEDEPYADWARPIREEARAGYLWAVRTLAGFHRSAGDIDQEAWFLLRLLGKDPYDESAHRSLVRALVSAGRHGEARRAFDRYADAMRTIDVAPPDLAVLAPGRAPVGAGAGHAPVRTATARPARDGARAPSTGCRW